MNLGSSSGSRSLLAFFICAAIAVIIVAILSLWNDEEPLPPKQTPVSASAPPPSTGTTSQKKDVERPSATGIAVAGLVKNSQGEAVQDALIQVLPLSKTQGRQMAFPPLDTQPLAKTSSESDGKFAMTCAIRPGAYWFRVSAKSYAQLEAYKEIPKEGVADLEFVLDAGTSVSGRVVDLDRVPVVNAFAFVKASDGRCQHARTAKDGSFQLPAVKAGHLNSYVRFSWTRMWNESSANVQETPLLALETEPGKTYSDIELVVPWSAKSRSLDGIVVDIDNRPVQGARVWATRVSNPIFSKCGETQSPTGPKGEFIIDRIHTSAGAVIAPEDLESALAFEEVFLHCEHPQYETTHLKNVRVGTSGVIVVLEQRERGSITGRVLDRVSRSPITDARVAAWNSLTSDGRSLYDKDEFNNLAMAGSGRVDSQGEFRCDNVRCGTVMLVAYSPSLGITFEPGVIVKREETTDVEILVDASGTLEVHFPIDDVTFSVEAKRYVCVSPEATESSAFPPFSSEAVSFLDYEPDKRIPDVFKMNLAPGKYRVLSRVWRSDSLQGPGTYFWQQHVEISPGQVTSIEAASPATGVMRLLLPTGVNTHRAEILIVPGGDPGFLSELEVPIGFIDHGALLDEYPQALLIFDGMPETIADFVPAGPVAVLVNLNPIHTDEWRQLGVKVVDIQPEQETLVSFSEDGEPVEQISR